MPTRNGRPPMSREEIARRYPRLLRAMRWVAILSTTEAECAIDCWRNYTLEWSSEAVNHYGGNEKVIRRAFETRRITYQDPRWRWGALAA